MWGRVKAAADAAASHAALHRNAIDANFTDETQAWFTFLAIFRSG